jgi:protein-disulfide isomerase
LAKKLGITGTPALILPNGRVSSGFRDAAAIKELVDKK